MLIAIPLLLVGGTEMGSRQSASVDKLFCEFHPYAWKDFGYNKEDMRQFLALHGYRCFDMYFKEHKVFDNNVYIGLTYFYKSD